MKYAVLIFLKIRLLAAFNFVSVVFVIHDLGLCKYNIVRGK